MQEVLIAEAPVSRSAILTDADVAREIACRTWKGETMDAPLEEQMWDHAVEFDRRQDERTATLLRRGGDRITSLAEQVRALTMAIRKIRAWSRDGSHPSGHKMGEGHECRAQGEDVRYVVERRSIPGADAVAHHIFDSETWQEMGRFMFLGDAELACDKMNREYLSAHKPGRE